LFVFLCGLFYFHPERRADCFDFIHTVPPYAKSSTV
jgi:hypothetical protein